MRWLHNSFALEMLVIVIDGARHGSAAGAHYHSGFDVGNLEETGNLLSVAANCPEQGAG